MSGTDSEPISPSLPTGQHLPPRFLELQRRVHASEAGDGERVRMGRFEIIRLLGAGGFGLVFLARDAKLNRFVAVKLCPIPSPAAGDLMGFEAKMLAMFSHPNIVTVHEVGTHEGDVFYAMEYIEGCDGGAFIRLWRDWRAAVAVYEAAATGLAAAHERGIVHGDFKPENVLIGDARVCVADFGLAQWIDTPASDTDARVSHRLGTLPYMAPELLRGKPASPASDQWALCVSLWETLYGRRPFAGRTVAALLDSIERGLPTVVVMIPGSVLAVLRKGLSVDPADRYPNMRALIEALQQTRSPNLASSQPSTKRRGWLGYALSLACGVFFGVYGVAHYTVGPTRTQEPERVEPTPKHEPTGSAPEPEPVSPCVLDGRSPKTLSDSLVAACQLIRENEIIAAHDKWTGERDDRLARIEKLAQPDAAKKEALQAELTADSGIISRTFQDQASRLTDDKPGLAALAKGFAQFWMTGAADVTTKD